MRKVAFLGLVTSLAVGSIALAESEHANDRHGGLFARLDANGDGKVTRTESDAGAKQLFVSLDENKDGRVSNAEARALGGEKLARMHERGRMHFAKFDSNSDGSIDTAELQSETKARFEKLDADHDGAIEKTELPKRGHGFHGREGGKRGKDCADHGGVKSPSASESSGKADKPAPSQHNVAGSAG